MTRTLVGLSGEGEPQKNSSQNGDFPANRFGPYAFSRDWPTANGGRNAMTGEGIYLVSLTPARPEPGGRRINIPGTEPASGSRTSRLARLLRRENQ